VLLGRAGGAEVRLSREEFTHQPEGLSDEHLLVNIAFHKAIERFVVFNIFSIPSSTQSPSVFGFLNSFKTGAADAPNMQEFFTRLDWLGIQSAGGLDWIGYLTSPSA
jgi:hypothetical protein